MKISKEQLIKIIKEEINSVIQMKVGGQDAIVEKDYELEDCLEEEDQDKEKIPVTHW
mgnify:CR=1 FL=1